ncbi:PPE domain-containing protein [Mycobacterium rhizamassiliense]|uniref:PPE domain-containing protein n=1 Tax=Mycobacterium rhizamassiliense TaxID=1841860 RepID=UPI00097D16E4|nr:PPE domain-containing protein [Mycobacterium rhizamassiliense]
MADPRFNGPPEIVASIFEAGNPASVLANNAVWVTETANKEIAAGLSTVNAFATAAQWQGMGGVASMATSTGLNVGLHTLVGWTAHKIGVTTAAVEAFTLARSSVIPSVVSVTNRMETVVLYNTNFIGQNTPAIAEREHEYYLEHWPQNSTVGWAYASALAALVAALAVPPPLAPMGASPAAPASAAAAVGQAAAQGGMNGAMQAGSQATQGAGQAAAAPAEGGSQMSSMMQMPMQMMQSVMEPMQSVLKAPMEAFQGLGQMPMQMMQSMGGLFSGAGGGNAGAAGAAAEPLLAGAGGAGCWRGREHRQQRGRPHQLHAPHQQLRAGDGGQANRAARRRAQRRRSTRTDGHNRHGRIADADVAGRHAGARQGGRRRQGRRPRPRGRGSRPGRRGVAPSAVSGPDRVDRRRPARCATSAARRRPTR